MSKVYLLTETDMQYFKETLEKVEAEIDAKYPSLPGLDNGWNIADEIKRKYRYHIWGRVMDWQK